jgi:hypothetical protein
MPSIVKTLSAPQGRALSNRYQAKRFAHAQDMHAFLNKGDNALHWREVPDDLKAGVYFTQIGHANGKATVRYISEKSLR